MDGQEAGSMAGGAAGQEVSPLISPFAGNVPLTTAVWPTVLGVIAIVVGCLGVVQGVMTIAAPFITGLFSSLVPKGQPNAFAAVGNWRWSSMSIGVLGAAVALLLLAGGIGVCRRRRWGSRVTLTWAALKIVSVVVISVVAALIQQDQFAVMQQGPNMPSMPMGLIRALIGFSVFLSIAWGWALPIFFLIWFTRAGVKPEVARWP